MLCFFWKAGRVGCHRPENTHSGKTQCSFSSSFRAALEHRPVLSQTGVSTLHNTANVGRMLSLGTPVS
ncbi:MAG: hypothetical protein D6679_07225 [Candidatus Hydrogenedentota bacterium]|nr:MAG: hypothetical protein D6679_07225 [Candidatus Hydrogenedentota bacterium]